MVIKLIKLSPHNLPNSLGKLICNFYRTFRIQKDNDEWKIMAMSGYDYDCKDEIRKIKMLQSINKWKI